MQKAEDLSEQLNKEPGSNNHICTLTIELEKRFLDCVANQDEKSLDEFRELIKNPEIIHHLALMPKTARAGADLFLKQRGNATSDQLFEGYEVRKAVPLYIAILSGNVEKVATILCILNLSPDNGWRDFIEKMKISLSSEKKDLRLWDAIRSSHTYPLLQSMIYELLGNRRTTDRQNLVRLLNKGISLSARLFTADSGSIEGIICHYFKFVISDDEIQLFLKNLRAEIHALGLVEFEKTDLKPHTETASEEADQQSLMIIFDKHNPYKPKSTKPEMDAGDKVKDLAKEKPKQQ